MTLSRMARAGLAAFMVARPRVRVRAAAGRADLVVQHRPHVRLAAQRADLRVVDPGVAQPRCPGRAGRLGQGRARRHRPGPGPRHDGVVRRRPLPVLRPGGGVDPHPAADRAARHRHRDRPVQRHHDDAAAAGGELRPVHRHRRSRDVLRGGGLQQRAGPAAAHRRLASRRRRWTSARDVVQTFRYVTFPAVRSALLAGALLAFALSFDEIIVTTFTAGASVQTLPLWIFANLARPNQAPVVTVVAAVLIIASIIPVWLAQRVSSDTSGGRL